MDKRILGEFMGTMVLVLMGNGVVAGVLLRKSKAEASGWMVIATGWALAVMCGLAALLVCAGLVPGQRRRSPLPSPLADIPD